jgi:hypothetical protein
MGVSCPRKCVAGQRPLGLIETSHLSNRARAELVAPSSHSLVVPVRICLRAYPGRRDSLLGKVAVSRTARIFLAANLTPGLLGFLAGSPLQRHRSLIPPES